MQYLCEKQLTAGGVTYHPGEIIPDGVILPERSRKLARSGHISELNESMKYGDAGGSGAYYTHEQLDRMLAEAVDEAVNNTVTEMKKEQEKLQEYVSELQETAPGAYDGTVVISVRSGSDGVNEQVIAVPATPEEIRQGFGIMQMNAVEGAEAIAGVKSENVLILLHAADTRKTIKDAAKKQAENIFSTSGSTNESTGGNATTGTNTEGADT